MNQDRRGDIHPKEWEFEFRQRNAHPPIMADLWLRAVRDRFTNEIGLLVSVSDYLIAGNHKGYIKTENKKDILRHVREAAGDQTFRARVFDRTMSVMDELGVIIDRIVADVARDPSDATLVRAWDAFETKMLEVVPWFWIPWYLTEENVLSDRAREGLMRHRATIEEITDFNNALGVLLFPDKEMTFQQEQRSFYELTKLARSSSMEDETFRRKAEQHLADFAWMTTFILLPIEPLSMDGLIHRVEEARKTRFIEEYELQEQKRRENARLARALEDLLREDAELQHQISEARELGWILMVSVENVLKNTARLLPFFKAMAQALHIPYAHWVYLTSEEIHSGLYRTSDVTTLDIQARKRGFVALMLDGSIAWRFGKEAEELTTWIESTIGAVDEAMKEFSGQAAYPGKVTSNVRLALTPDQSKTLIDGEILVTSMTSPDYVPAMRKASAIVTDEGGLLCHAAIMSREFGKPCIIGTKIATRVLKDGDEVEVDATKGTVRIMKKHEVLL